jgi:hypothetical protein
MRESVSTLHKVDSRGDYGPVHRAFIPIQKNKQKKTTVTNGTLTNTDSALSLPRGPNLGIFGQ